MDVFVMNHKPMKGKDSTLPKHCQEWFSTNSVRRVVLLTIEGMESNFLESEVNDLVPGVDIETLKLPKIGLGEQQTPSELSNLPWLMLTKICRLINPEAKTTMLLGRGAAIYDHILWLASQCYSHVEILHIDSCEPVLSIHNLRKHAPIESEILPAMIASFLEDIVNDRFDAENIGYIDSERFMDFAKATGLKGIAPALKQMVDEGGIEKYTSKKDVTYRLNPKALPDAASKYFSQLPEKSSDLPNLTIAFGRLPNIQTKNNDRQVEFEFFSYLNPLQPMDGLLVVLQRHDDSIPFSAIMTLEQALKKFDHEEDLSFKQYHGDLIHAYNALDSRTKEYAIDTKQHLVIINPSPNLEFQMNVFLHLLARCVEFEKTHGPRLWDIDLTMPLNPIRSAISFFSYITHSAPTYVLKPRISKDMKIIPRRSLVLSPPNRIALEAIEQYLGRHGNTKGGPNLLVALYKWELENIVEDDGDLFAAMNDAIQNSVSFGLSPKDLKAKLEEYGLLAGNKQIHRNLGKLAQARLVRQIGREFFLTNLGRFVAEQIINIRQSEVERNE